VTLCPRPVPHTLTNRRARRWLDDPAIVGIRRSAVDKRFVDFDNVESGISSDTQATSNGFRSRRARRAARPPYNPRASQRAIGIAERRTFRNLRYRADAPGFPSAKSLAHLSDERDMGYLPSGNVERDVAAANPRHVCPRYSTTLAVKQYGMLFRTS